jgi:hypothetical protein
MTQPPPVKLVTHISSHDTTETLEMLTDADRRGQLLGIFYGVMFSDRGVDFGYTGVFDVNPLFARSIVAELDDDLSMQTKAKCYGTNV